MKIRDVVRILDAEVYCGKELFEFELASACGADLMSDVLAFVKDQPVLLTGLVNPQVVRTADMMDINCVVFVRGKRPEPAMIELAREREMALLSTEYTMYAACGRLYAGGLTV